MKLSAEEARRAAEDLVRKIKAKREVRPRHRTPSGGCGQSRGLGAPRCARPRGLRPHAGGGPDPGFRA